MSKKKIFIISALVVLTCAAFQVTNTIGFPYISLFPLGVALFVASFLVD